MRVTIPIHITKTHEFRKFMECKQKTEQIVAVITRQYPITTGLRWRFKTVKMISSSSSVISKKSG